MNILVTGGAGFIGSNVADAFIGKGHRVIILDDLSSGKKENINPMAEFHHLSIGDPAVEKIFADNRIDLLCHHAAQMDVRKSITDPVFDSTTNIVYGIKLLEYCVKYGVKKITYSSTGGAIYGEPQYLPADENHPIRPLCPYGISKHAFEHYIEFYHDIYGLDYTIMRYANIYGPRQDPHGEAGVVAIFSGLMLEGQQPKVFGDGESTRDYLYVGDVVSANLLTLEKGSGEIMNLGTGIETSVNELYNRMRKIMGLNFDAIHAPARKGEVERICLSARKAEEILGWKPAVSLDSGLEETIRFFQEKKEVRA